MISFKHFFFRLNSVFSFREILFVSILSVMMGWFIYLTYRISNKTKPDKLFTGCLILLAPICSAVVYSVNSLCSILLLLAVIIAFIVTETRLSVKYRNGRIFCVWSVACGVLCAEKQFIPSAILCVLVFIVFWIVNVIIDDRTKLLIIQGDPVRKMDVQALVFRLFNKKATLFYTNADGEEHFELIYKVPSSSIEDLRENRINLIDEIERIGGVSTVKIQKEDSVDEE